MKINPFHDVLFYFMHRDPAGVRAGLGEKIEGGGECFPGFSSWSGEGRDQGRGGGQRGFWGGVGFECR